jgi:guanylate kinase
MYGTSKKAVHDVAAKNMICILDVDEQGVKALKATDLEPIYIFVKPPSIEELERRLRGRGTETEEKIQARMDTAKSAIEYADSGAYDHVIGWFSSLDSFWMAHLKSTRIIDFLLLQMSFTKLSVYFW